MKDALKKSIVLSFKILGYQEDGECVAHALEADILGCGATPEEAYSDLMEALDAQISFAMHKGDLDLIIHPAPQEFFDRWDAAHDEFMRKNFFSGSLPKKTPAASLATMFGFSSDDLEKMGSRRLEFAGA